MLKVEIGFPRNSGSFTGIAPDKVYLFLGLVVENEVSFELAIGVKRPESILIDQPRQRQTTSRPVAADEGKISTRVWPLESLKTLQCHRSELWHSY
jgi:hypothetical protein